MAVILTGRGDKGWTEVGIGSHEVFEASMGSYDGRWVDFYFRTPATDGEEGEVQGEGPPPISREPLDQETRLCENRARDDAPFLTPRSRLLCASSPVAGTS